MNYSTLFPEMLKKMPSITNNDICYHYQRNNNDNKKTHIFIPQGKQMILWFVKYNKQNYSILLEYNRHKQNIQKCYFQYLSFKYELTNKCGTMILCTKNNNEICLQKIIYFMGKKYEHKNISKHLYDLKYMLENYIHQIKHNDFIQLKLPIMSNNIHKIFQVSNLPYCVHSIMNLNQYQIFIKEFCANFTIYPVDIKKDIYTLYDNKNNMYSSAFVNDIKTSQLLKYHFLKKNITYNDIEYSDDEMVEEVDEEDTLAKQKMKIQCIFIPHLKKWKPYKITSNPISTFDDIKKIELRKYEYYL